MPDSTISFSSLLTRRIFFLCFDSMLTNCRNYLDRAKALKRQGVTHGTGKHQHCRPAESNAQLKLFDDLMFCWHTVGMPLVSPVHSRLNHEPGNLKPET